MKKTTIIIMIMMMFSIVLMSGIADAVPLITNYSIMSGTTILNADTDMENTAKRQVVYGNTSKIEANVIYITLVGGNTEGMQFDKVSFCVANSSMNCTPGTRKNVTFSGNRNGFAPASFGKIVSDPLSFNYNLSAIYLLNLDFSSNSSAGGMMRITSSYHSPGVFYSSGAADWADFDQTPSAPISAAYTTMIYEINGTNLTSPIILNSTYNMTSALSWSNGTAWRDAHEYVPIATTDTTPTVTFNTDINAYCRIDDASGTWAVMGDSRNCSSTGGTNHVCSLAAADAVLVGGYDSVYVSCIDQTKLSYSNASMSPALNLSVYADTTIASGIFNASGTNTSVLLDNLAFDVWANFSYDANGSAVYPGGWCNYSIANLSIVSQNLMWNVTNGLLMSSDLSFSENGTFTVYVDCFSNISGFVLNESFSMDVTVNNKPPSVGLFTVWDYHDGLQSFVDNVSARYPLNSTLNISGGCNESQTLNFNLTLFYDNLTMIGSVVDANNGSFSFNFTRNNFSDATMFLDGLRFYYAVLTCTDEDGASVSANHSFRVLDNAPIAVWNNASGGAYTTDPTFNFYCLDNETGLLDAYVLVNGTVNVTNNSISNFTNYDFLTHYANSGYNVTLFCEDDFRNNSNNASLIFLLNSNCDLNIISPCGGCRYQDNTVLFSMNCSNGVPATNCYYSINDFTNVSFACAGVNVSVELGWNRLNASIFNVDGSYVSRDVDFWAKKMDSSIFDYPVIWFMIAVAVFLFLGGVLLSVPFLSAIGSLFVGFVGYELLSISMFSGGMTIIAGILMALYFAFKQK